MKRSPLFDVLLLDDEGTDEVDDGSGQVRPRNESNSAEEECRQPDSVARGEPKKKRKNKKKKKAPKAEASSLAPEESRAEEDEIDAAMRTLGIDRRDENAGAPSSSSGRQASQPVKELLSVNPKLLRADEVIRRTPRLMASTLTRLDAVLREFYNHIMIVFI